MTAETRRGSGVRHNGRRPALGVAGVSHQPDNRPRYASDSSVDGHEYTVLEVIAAGTSDELSAKELVEVANDVHFNDDLGLFLHAVCRLVTAKDQGKCIVEDSAEDIAEHIPEDISEDITEDIGEDLAGDKEGDRSQDLWQETDPDSAEDTEDDLDRDTSRDFDGDLEEDLSKDRGKDLAEDLGKDLWKGPAERPGGRRRG